MKKCILDTLFDSKFLNFSHKTSDNKHDFVIILTKYQSSHYDFS